MTTSNASDTADAAPVADATPDATGDAQEEGGPEVDDDKTGREAAKYRRKLRETESERDTLRARVEHMQRGEIERLAADKLADPADIWRDGADLGSLLDDDGNVSGDKVNELLGGLLEQHGHWGAHKPNLSRHRNTMGSGASASTQPRQDSWEKAFQPRAR